MVNPFKARRPWVVFLLVFLLHPFLGMLYIGRARLAGYYFLLELAVLGAFVVLYPAVLGSMRVADAVSVFELPFTLIGASHAAYLAWKHKPSLPVAWYGRWYTVLGIPVGYVVVAFAITRLLFMPYYLPSQGMLPSFGVDDKFLASRRSYDFHNPARGDVIAFHVARKNAVFIKRIIGLPRDRVTMRGGVVFVNGRAAAQSPRGGGYYTEVISGRAYVIRKRAGGGSFDDTDEVTVPAGQYFVLGDNRDNSLDSRFSDFGLVARKDIVGPIVFKFFDGPSRHFVFQLVN